MYDSRVLSAVKSDARQKRWVLICAVLASTMAFVDESVVTVALPRMEADLRTSLSAMQWVINAYTLCMSALLLIGGLQLLLFARWFDMEYNKTLK